MRAIVQNYSSLLGICTTGFLAIVLLYVSTSWTKDKSPSQNYVHDAYHITKELPPILLDRDSEVEFMKTVDFELFNHADRAVTIKTIRWNCSCTEATTSSRVIESHSSTKLLMKMNIRGRSGPQRFHCEVIPDDGQPWVCEVLTIVIPNIEYDPAVVDLGNVLSGGNARQEFVIHTRANVPDATPAIQEIICNNPLLKAEIVSTEESELFSFKQLSTLVRIEAHGTDEIGDYHDTILPILTSNQQTGDVIPLQVTWRVIGLIEVAPKKLLLAIDKETRQGEGVLILRSTCGDELYPLEEYIQLDTFVSMRSTLSEDRRSILARIRVNLEQHTSNYLCLECQFSLKSKRGISLIRFPLLASLAP